MDSYVSQSAFNTQARYVRSEADESVYLGGELKQGRGEDCRTRKGLLPIGQPGKAYGITQEEKGRPSLSLGQYLSSIFNFYTVESFTPSLFPWIYISTGSKGR